MSSLVTSSTVPTSSAADAANAAKEAAQVQATAMPVSLICAELVALHSAVALAIVLFAADHITYISSMNLTHFRFTSFFLQCFYQLQYRMVLAACSGMVAATVCHPLDVIRVQMHTEGTQFKSTVDAGLSIYRNGGLYAGISAAYLRQWLYGSFRIGVYSYQFEHAQLENQKAGRSKNDISFANKLRFGCVSGAIGSFVGTPSEVA